MTGLYVIAILSIIVDISVGYLSLGIVLAEHKDIYLPFIKYVYE